MCHTSSTPYGKPHFGAIYFKELVYTDIFNWLINKAGNLWIFVLRISDFRKQIIFYKCDGDRMRQSFIVGNRFTSIFLLIFIKVYSRLGFWIVKQLSRKIYHSQQNIPIFMKNITNHVICKACGNIDLFFKTHLAEDNINWNNVKQWISKVITQGLQWEQLTRNRTTKLLSALYNTNKTFSIEVGAITNNVEQFIMKAFQKFLVQQKGRTYRLTFAEFPSPSANRRTIAIPSTTV